MRPRHKAAENGEVAIMHGGPFLSFNEAAA